jgi:hypothetical protein
MVEPQPNTGPNAMANFARTAFARSSIIICRSIRDFADRFLNFFVESPIRLRNWSTRHSGFADLASDDRVLPAKN